MAHPANFYLDHNYSFVFAAQGNNIPTARIKSVVEIFGHNNNDGDDEDRNCVIVNNGDSGGTESCSCPAGPAGSD